MERRIEADKRVETETMGGEIGKIAVRNGPGRWNWESKEEARKQTLFYHARDGNAHGDDITRTHSRSELRRGYLDGCMRHLRSCLC
jgi:hypothetical protein